MSRTQTNVVKLAKAIVEYDRETLNPSEQSFLTTASGMKNQPLNVHAHKVLCDFAKKKGFFADKQHAA